MSQNSKSCFKCGNTDGSLHEILYGYTICKDCKSRLGLFQDQTVKKHHASFENARALDPSQPSYEEDIRFRLDFIKKDYIAKKIKLLHILESLQGLK